MVKKYDLKCILLLFNKENMPVRAISPVFFRFHERKKLKYKIATNLVTIHFVLPRIHCEAMRLLLFQLPAAVVSYVNHTASCLITT